MFGIMVFAIMIVVLMTIHSDTFWIDLALGVGLSTFFFLLAYAISWVIDYFKKKEEQEELKRIRAEHWEKLQERIKQQEEQQKQY